MIKPTVLNLSRMALLNFTMVLALATPTMPSTDSSIDTIIITVTVEESRTALLPCSAPSQGSFEVVWLDESDQILTFKDSRLVSDLRISVERPLAERWDLRIRDVQHKDAGEYKCHIKTGLDDAMVKTVRLFVKDSKASEPEIEAIPSVPKCRDIHTCLYGMDLVLQAARRGNTASVCKFFKPRTNCMRLAIADCPRQSVDDPNLDAAKDELQRATDVQNKHCGPDNQDIDDELNCTQITQCQYDEFLYEEVEYFKDITASCNLVQHTTQCLEKLVEDCRSSGQLSDEDLGKLIKASLSIREARFSRLCQATQIPVESLTSARYKIRSVTGRVKEKESAILPCRKPLGALVAWSDDVGTLLYYDKLYIKEDKRFGVGVPESDSVVLLIKNVTKGDAGDYYCFVATDTLRIQKVTLLVQSAGGDGDQEAKKSRIKFPVEFYDSPELFSTPTRVTVKENETAVLKCAASKLGKHTVTWSKEDSVLAVLDRVEAKERFRIVRPYVRDWNLHILRARPSDAGVYNCVVNTSPPRKKKVTLVVQENARWSGWGKWSECSKDCGGGERKRTRNCTGRKCEGSDTERRKCNVRPCKSTGPDETNVNSLLNTAINPFIKWLKSGTKLNDAQRKLAVEQTHVAKLMRKKLKLDIRLLERGEL